MPAPKGHKPYPGCEKGGRPKMYTKEFIEKEADALLEWMQLPESLYLKEFAVNRGYSSNRLYEWQKENEKFAGVIERAHDRQECKLVKGALVDAYNAGFTKFILINKHGFKDKVEEAQEQVTTYVKNYGGNSE